MLLRTLFVFACLVAPFLIMWRLILVRRQVREIMRERRAAPREEELPAEPGYSDTVRGADGLTYARSYDANEELLAASRAAAEPSDIKNLEGRR